MMSNAARIVVVRPVLFLMGPSAMPSRQPGPYPTSDDVEITGQIVGTISEVVGEQTDELLAVTFAPR